MAVTQGLNLSRQLEAPWLTQRILHCWNFKKLRFKKKKEKTGVSAFSFFQMTYLT